MPCLLAWRQREVVLTRPRCSPDSLMYGALFFTVVLLVIIAYFLTGGLPLLVLKHDVPLDARFIGSFFNAYYRLSFWASLGAAISYAIWGRYPFAMGASLSAAVAMLLRKEFIQAMERLGERIDVGEAAAIQRLRRVHSAALTINCLQLVVVVWGIFQVIARTHAMLSVFDQLLALGRRAVGRRIDLALTPPPRQVPRCPI